MKPVIRNREIRALVDEGVLVCVNQYMEQPEYQTVLVSKRIFDEVLSGSGVLAGDPVEKRVRELMDFAVRGNGLFCAAFDIDGAGPAVFRMESYLDDNRQYLPVLSIWFAYEREECEAEENEAGDNAAVGMLQVAEKEPEETDGTCRYTDGLMHLGAESDPWYVVT